MRRIAILLPNYNMPERTDALCRYIRLNVAWPHDLIVVDNGSDLGLKSQYTTLPLVHNIQTTGGWLAGLECADSMAHLRGEPYFAYWFLITSAAFPAGNSDPLTPLAEALVDNPDAVGIHPALTESSTTAWTHLKQRGKGLRPTWMIDNIASLYRADWFDQNGRFDPALTYGWGIDLETCYKARCQGRKLFVHDDVLIEKISDIGYTMNRMNMSARSRGILAGQNMHDVLSQRYGFDWLEKMKQEHVTHEMV